MDFPTIPFHSLPPCCFRGPEKNKIQWDPLSPLHELWHRKTMKNMRNFYKVLKGRPAKNCWALWSMADEEPTTLFKNFCRAKNSFEGSRDSFFPYCRSFVIFLLAIKRIFSRVKIFRWKNFLAVQKLLIGWRSENANKLLNAWVSSLFVWDGWERDCRWVAVRLRNK